MEEKRELSLKHMRILKTELTRFLMTYKFGLDELNTKIDILKQEFQYVHDYNPIEHVKSRIKTPESILKKIYRKGYELSLPSIKENIQDIAGIRIVCSFVSDIYKLSEMLQNQKDIKTIKCKDYIKNPKPNGYQSLHLILQVPVFMSDRVEDICVEVQIRTIGMDFWASLEHKIYYKYNKEVPKHLTDELREAAISVAQLDKKMENINKAVNSFKEADNPEYELQEIFIDDKSFYLPDEFLRVW
ncbi:GTP pyrophosphokinase family protein [Clostridium sp. CX1]|uniref:GTP pyrophosphokinase family protein n=1 Tax=Clostridium tanneri TaxID=3037988 RepID=A0ABU4JVH1_9CLOT|nr:MULTISPECIES: GTP pyrophosphokinase family protein [unclassified Clostridium]MCT8975255.1 GTP pyrophosphokinase family protein [Clostridium sp. CX1]MDW8802107.1 GTP pyrophosphokinase family protein [Clostridium sp. A1-XYC3]